MEYCMAVHRSKPRLATEGDVGVWKAAKMSCSKHMGNSSISLLKWHHSLPSTQFVGRRNAKDIILDARVDMQLKVNWKNEQREKKYIIK